MVIAHAAMQHDANRIISQNSMVTAWFCSILAAHAALQYDIIIMLQLCWELAAWLQHRYSILAAHAANAVHAAVS